MSTIIEIMLAVRERNPVYYHKDTKMFDRISYSKVDNMDPNARLPIGNDRNTVILPTYEEICRGLLPALLYRRPGSVILKSVR